MTLRVAAHNGARRYGGGEKWTVLLLSGLQDRGHAVHLFCGHPEIVERARAAGVPASIGRLGGQLMVPHAVLFSRQLARFRPDALLLGTFKKIWLGGMAARWAGVPTVVSRIGLSTDLPRRHWTYRTALERWVDAVLVNADSIRKDFVAHLPSVDPARVITVYDGIAMEQGRVGQAEARVELDLPLDTAIVGTVTRLSDQKRIDRLLETMAMLPHAHCAIAGEGPLEGALRRQAAKLGIGERVHFLGYRSDVVRVLSALDVFVLTSDREGMANAMLEAMAAGVPVVSTPVSGADEALAAGPNGRLPGLVVPPHPAALAEAIAGILDGHAVRIAMSEEGRRRGRERFSFDRMLDAWEAVLGGEPPGPWHRGASPLLVRHSR